MAIGPWMESQMYPSVTMKRNWLHRESIMESMVALGLPANLDSTHVVAKGVDTLAQWIAAAGDDVLASTLGVPIEPLEQFKLIAGPMSVTHMSSPGISYRGGGSRPVLDGVAMRIRFCTTNSNEGPEAFIFPINRQMLNSGAEWNEHVALIPRAALDRWSNVLAASSHIFRMMNLSAMSIRVFNGPDEQIQPMTLDDIILNQGIKDDVASDVKGFLSKRDAYKSRRLPWTRKYLFNGPPGTGKTSLARWISTEMNLQPVSLDFTDRYVDGRDFKRFLNWARNQAPAVVVLDDFEKILGGENRSGITQHTILTSMSGMGNLDGLIFVITSNSTEPFNGPMRRRFDRIIEIPLPDVSSRKEYLRRMFVDDKVSESYIASIATRTNGWSFDDLRGIVAAAMGFAVTDELSEAAIERGMKAVSSRRSSQE